MILKKVVKEDKVFYEPISFEDDYNHTVNLPKLITYLVLFVLTFLVVCRVLPFWIVLPIGGWKSGISIIK